MKQIFRILIRLGIVSDVAHLLVSVKARNGQVRQVTASDLDIIWERMWQ